MSKSPKKKSYSDNDEIDRQELLRFLEANDFTNGLLTDDSFIVVKGDYAVVPRKAPITYSQLKTLLNNLGLSLHDFEMSLEYLENKKELEDLIKTGFETPPYKKK
ncbi:MAG: hypothetical protein ACK5LL_14870 [Suipraeoptans sp.]